MARYILYPLFGIGVLGAYVGSSMGSVDLTSTTVYRSTVPANSLANFQAAPILFRSDFSGPRANIPTVSSSSGGGGGGYYGGVGYGK